MPYYRRRPTGESELSDATAAPAMLTREAANLTRRLLPFPGMAEEPLKALTTTPTDILDLGTTLNPLGASPDNVREQATALLPRAAAILDEEMARGVINARDMGPTSPSNITASPINVTAGTDLAEDIYRFAQRLLALIPGPVNNSTPPDSESLPLLRAKGKLAPGQSARLSMQVHNEENRALRLMPSATDLVGEGGGRIPARWVEFAQKDLQLQAGERQLLNITVQVPPGSLDGYYTGLVVIAGAGPLRALVCVEVARL